MKIHVLTGAAVGILASLLSWSRNATPNQVSIFPDLVTLIGFALLLSIAIAVASRRSKPKTRTDVWRVGLVVAASAGTFLGGALVLIAANRLSNLSFLMGTFVFGVALGTALLIGTAVVFSRLGGVTDTKHGISA